LLHRRKDGNKNLQTHYGQYGGSGEWDGDGNDNGKKKMVTLFTHTYKHSHPLTYTLRSNT